MKTVSYSERGMAFPDFVVERDALCFCLAPDWDLITVSTENFITAVRVLIKEKVISHESIVFEFNGTLLYPNESGRILDWPDGFCDFNEKFYLRLL